MRFCETVKLRCRFVFNRPGFIDYGEAAQQWLAFCLVNPDYLLWRVRWDKTHQAAYARV